MVFNLNGGGKMNYGYLAIAFVIGIFVGSGLTVFSFYWFDIDIPYPVHGDDDND